VKRAMREARGLEGVRRMIKGKPELRRYMGPKYARVPRGAIVYFLGSYRRMGFFEWNSERFCCPVRLLWRIKDEVREVA